MIERRGDHFLVGALLGREKLFDGYVIFIRAKVVLAQCDAGFEADLTGGVILDHRLERLDPALHILLFEQLDTAVQEAAGIVIDAAYLAVSGFGFAGCVGGRCLYNHHRHEGSHRQ